MPRYIQILFWIAEIIILGLVVTIIYKINQTQKATSQKPARSLLPSNNVTMTKNAIDDLVKKAADQQYLDDVLNSGPTLPLPNHRHHLIQLQPKINNTPEKVTTKTQTTNITPTKTTTSNQQCQYQNKTYSIGDIIQTDQGWARCTPALQPNTDGSNQYLKAVWTLQDKLL